jgi:hypothetical protein
MDAFVTRPTIVHLGGAASRCLGRTFPTRSVKMYALSGSRTDVSHQKRENVRQAVISPGYAASSDSGVGVQARDQQVDPDEIEPERRETDDRDHGGPGAAPAGR